MTKLKQILFVEDDPADVEMTLSALKAHNLANQVIVARDGAEALDYLFRRGIHAGRPENLPVVILLDLKLPKVDGIEVLQQIRAEPRFKSVPIVVLTSSIETKDLDDCYRLGVNAYVVKPLQFEDFVNAIGHLGVFWALLNEPPPACGLTRASRRGA